MSKISSRSLLIGLLWGCLIPALLLVCMAGQIPFAPAEVLAALAPCSLFPDLQVSETASLVITQIRLPRALAALMIGGGLALAGVILQGCLRNPLADPFTLGISAGAACGASLALALGFNLPFAGGPELSVALTALAGAALALVLALLLGHSQGGLTKQSIILAGIAVSAFMGAIVALVKALNEESVASIVFWILGSFQGISWQKLPLLALTLVPGLPAALWGWRKLDILCLGDGEAAWLGLNAHACRFWLLFSASFLTAGCVATAGIIGFVGLVAPHILRLLLGPAHGPLILAAIPAGALLLLACDAIARTILDGGQELPVGIVTALIGAPFFALLIRLNTRP